ncbi:MAG: A24 family peptidase [Pirellulaceae bacterium]
MTRRTRRPLLWIGSLLGPALLCLIGMTVTVHLLPYPLGTACGLIFLGVLLVCTWTDSRDRKIPNWLTYPAFSWALALNAAGSLLAGSEPSPAPDSILGIQWEPVGPVSLGAIGIGWSLAGAAACFAVMLVASGWLRSAGGDVKLAVVLGAFLGVKYGLLALCFGYILAGVVSLAIVVWHYGAWNVLRGTLKWFAHLVVPLMVEKPQVEDDRLLKSPIPLGAYFALGAILAIQPLPGLTT